MVERQLRGRDISNPRVLQAMAEIPRHRFVSAGSQRDAYADHPLPIGHGQTISQPYIVALMTQLLQPQPADRVLEIGTGCGYQTAVLARLVQQVWTVEIVPALAQRAQATLAGLGCANVVFRTGDGRCGWPEGGPFDGIVVTAAPAGLPELLAGQLADGGRLVIPLGGRFAQVLHRFVRHGARLESEELISVRFVPLVGPPPAPP